MSHPVLPVVYDTRSWPGRTLHALDRFVLVSLLLAVTVMVGVVSAQVALRYGFNKSFDWADEVSRLAFVWSIFLAIPLGVRQGAHIGIDIVVAKMPSQVQMVLRRGGAWLCAAMMLVIAWAALGVATEQWDEFMSVLDWSVGWFIVPVGVGALLSAFHLVRIAIQGPSTFAAGSAE
ncbi:TRAP transporter small permease [Hydrogenophaga taeniospiralis]|uniref:TRAP transporter small permease n=1 Tax=Hydrogenophaga taeniospiralis TaxID=65656 RepID=UPI001CFB8374|nr:TRAP transporter small permease [Hydrogenophaga taeniospiralis]UCU94344.1 TRAP transporter small permease [Hydrogenophaga taeniospiralis]